MMIGWNSRHLELESLFICSTDPPSTAPVIIYKIGNID